MYIIETRSVEATGATRANYVKTSAMTIDRSDSDRGSAEDSKNTARL